MYMSRARGRSFLGALVDLPFSYAPSLAPVGSGSAYWPGDVQEDLFALNALGFFPDDGTAVRSYGTQADDMANQAGAWAPEFRAAVASFQYSVNLTPDTWIGPQTRTALAAAVRAANAGAPVPVPPGEPVPVDPGGVPALPAILPGTVPAESAPGMGVGTKIAIGVGVVALLGGGYYALK